MIVVAGEIHIDPNNREAAIPAAVEMMAETHKEHGCIHYRFYADLEDPGRFHVYEEWESLAALEAHFETAHMAAWRAKLAEIGVVKRDVKRFEAGPATPL